MKPTKAADAKELIARAKKNPGPELAAIGALATDPDWRTREVAATVLVEASRKHPAAIIKNAQDWAKNADENLRRAACEGLRALSKSAFPALAEVLNVLRADPSPYVRKSVANLLRDASEKNAEEVLALARRWRTASSPETTWILRNGLKKVAVTHGDEVAAILTTTLPPNKRL